MSRGSELRVLVTAALNPGASIRKLNADLQAIQSQLSVNVGINTQGLQEASKQIQQMQKVVETVEKDGMKVTRTHWQGVGNGFTEVTKQAEQTKKEIQATNSQLKDSEKNNQQPK